MNTKLAALTRRIETASPANRIDYRDELAGYGGEALDVVSPWLRTATLAPFAVRVVAAIVARDPSLQDCAMAVLRAVRRDGLATADVVRLLRELTPPPRRVQPRPSPISSPFAHDLYARAKEIDPHRAGIKADELHQAMKGESAMADRDETSVRSALNTAKDLFTKEGQRFVWRAEPKPGHSEGISGADLAQEAWTVARELDPYRQGVGYQDLRHTLESRGVKIAGANAGGTMHSALNGSPRFRRAKMGRGRFIWNDKAT